MPNDRRAFVPGGCFFFTVNLLERKQTCSSTISRACARRSLRRGPKSSLHHRRIRRVARSSACGLDPATGGLRCLDALAADQKPFCQSAAKTGSTQCRSQRARGERGIWQRRFWEHLIRDDADDARHVGYCHINPLKHGLVERDWPYSSFHRDVGAGCFRSIGAAISKRSVSLVSGAIGEANFTRGIAAWNGG